MRESVAEIFADVRSDHPSRSWVTLEQSVRRIEGLRHGIPLSESARLPHELPNVSKAVSNPSGRFVSAMRKLALLPDGPVSPELFRSVAKRMSESQISDVLLQAYSDVPEDVFPDQAAVGEPSFPIGSDVVPGPAPDSTSPSVFPLAAWSAALF